MQEEQQSDSFFVEESNTQPTGDTSYFDEGVSWTASEFIHHTKDIGWYSLVCGAIALMTGLGYLLTRDWFTPGAVICLGAIMLFIGNRKPRTINYHIDAHGIQIGEKHFAFEEFLSFSIIREDAIESIMLMPEKRFGQTISLYFAPEDGQKIFDILSSFIPFEQREKDLLDKFLHKIRF